MVSKSHFKTGYRLEGLKEHDGKSHNREVYGKVLDGYAVPYSILYDIPIQKERIGNLNQFVKCVDLDKLNSLIDHEKYSDKEFIKNSYGDRRNRYLLDMYKIFRFCTGYFDDDIESIIKRSQKLLDILPEMTLHMISMLSILGLIVSEPSYDEMNKFFKGEQHGPIYPEEVTIYITYNCNLSCFHCGFINDAFLIDDQEKDLFRTKKDQVKFMDIDLLRGISEECASLGCKRVYIDGGEVLLHPNISEIINIFSEKSFETILLTNGTLLNEKICDLLMRKGWDVVISIDGPDASTHDSIRGKGSFKKIINNMLILKKAKRKYNSGLINIHMVAQGRNADKIPDFRKLARTLGVDDFYIDLYYGTVQNFNDTSYEKINHAVNEMSKDSAFDHIRWIECFKNDFYDKGDLTNGIASKKFFQKNNCACYMFNKALTIDPFGDVYPCWKTLQSFNNMGNLNEKSLKEIWFGEKYSSFKKGLKSVKFEYDKRYENCVFCEFIPEIDKLNKKFKNIKCRNDDQSKKNLYVDFLHHSTKEDFCQISALEVQTYKDFLKEEYNLVDNYMEADLIIFNSCGSFGTMQKNNLKFIKEMNANKKQGAKLLVTGCLPKIDQEAIEKIGPDLVDQILQDKLDRIKNLAYEKNNDSNRYSKYDEQDDFIIKTGEGCAQDCTYCSIKLSRGNIKSKKQEHLIEEFKKGINKGFKNFIIVGTDVGSYGLDINTNIISLLNSFKECLKANKIDDKEINMEIEDFNPVWFIKYSDGLKKLVSSSKFIKKISLPLESCSKQILEKMNRRYDPLQVKEMIKEIKGLDPSVKISTHFIIGFPTETDNDFNKIFDFTESFDSITLIPFDRRKGTMAYGMEGQIDQETIRTRIKMAYKYIESQEKTVRIFPFEMEISILRELEKERY